MKVPTKILKALDEATEADLDDFDREISRCEALLRALKKAREVVAEEVLTRPAGVAPPAQDQGERRRRRPTAQARRPRAGHRP